MRNILVGADLTANSENAFIRAIQLARLAAAKLHVLHVAPRLQFPGRDSESSALESELSDRIDTFLQAQSKPAEIDYNVYLETRGRAYEVIDQYAARTRADLVIVGRSKRPGVIPSSVLLTTGQVVAMSDCPVLVVTQPVSGNYKDILLAADLSGSAQRSLATVCDFGPDVELTMLQSHAGGSPHGSFLQRLRAKSHQRRYRRIAARTVSLLQQRGLRDERFSLKATEQDPFDALLVALGETKFDVVVFADVRHRLRAPEMRDRLLSVVPAASCDILFDQT